MNSYINLNKSNCKNCYKCLRHCPVKSIRFSGHRAYIVGEECVLCGTCYVVCPQNAKEIVSSLEKAKTIVAQGQQTYLSVAPSFRAAFPGVTIAAFEEVAKKLGFAEAQETAQGAQIVAAEYDRLVSEGSKSVIISTCCPTVNLLVQKHFPQLLDCLAPVVSPMRAHARTFKAEHPGSKVIFVGPCVSKKYEADAYPQDVECVLTFEEFENWMKEKNLSFSKTEDSLTGGISRLFPTCGGVLNTMKCESENYTYFAIDGVENCIKALTDIKEGKLKQCFIEMSSCSGSCSQGPEITKHHTAPVSAFLNVKSYTPKKGLFEEPTENVQLEQNFAYLATMKREPTEEEIREVLRKTGKNKVEDELNCACCGYNTCREKAIAVLQGKADVNMCIPFLKEKAETLSGNILYNTPNGILILNEQLEVQQINEAARRLLNIRDAGDILGDNVIRILDPQDFMKVMDTGRPIKDKQVYLAEYLKYVRETIVYDPSYHNILCIFRDVTDEEDEKEKRNRVCRQTIETADKVVEKQMRVVQEIASLLGETTAETKIALTTLKESIKDE